MLTSLALSLSIFLAGTGVANAEERAPCVPSASVTGDAQLVDGVIRILKARSINVGTDSHCGVVRVALARVSGRVRIELSDQHGRHIVRAAPGARPAATIIESWVRRDLSDPLLAVPRGTREPVVSTTSQAVLPGDAEQAPLGITSAAKRGRSLHAASTGELGVGGDGSRWGGVRVTACVELGPLCVGGMVFLARDFETGGSAQTFATSRTRFDTLLSLDVPLRRGKVALVPGLGLGQSSVQAKRTMGDQTNEDDTGGLRLEAHASVDYRIRRRLYLRLSSSVGYAPGARTVLRDNQGAGEADTDAALAGQTSVDAWFGVGLRYASQ